MPLTRILKQAILLGVFAATLGLAGCMPGAQDPAAPAAATLSYGPTPTLNTDDRSKTSENSASPVVAVQNTATPTRQGEAQPTSVSATSFGNIGGGSLKMGDPQSAEMVVDDVDQVTFYLMILNFSKDEGQPTALEIEFNISGPGGEQVSMEHGSAMGFCIPVMWGYQCAVEDPTPGMWKVEVESKEVPEESAGFSVQTMFEGGVQVVAELSKEQVDPGEEIEITATVLDPAPLEGVDLTAFVLDYDTSATNPYSASLQLTDRGGGIYSQRLMIPREGEYMISLGATGINTRGHAFARTMTIYLEVGTDNPTSESGEPPYEAVMPTPTPGSTRP